jgi:hypothetical protein
MSCKPGSKCRPDVDWRDVLDGPQQVWSPVSSEEVDAEAEAEDEKELEEACGGSERSWAIVETHA